MDDLRHEGEQQPTPAEPVPALPPLADRLPEQAHAPEPEPPARARARGRARA